MMLFLLHGFTGAPSSWDAVRGSIDEATVLTPALFGHAGAEASSTTFIGEVRRLGSIAAQHDGTRIVCGYSLGARLALALTVEYPWLFSGAVLIGAQPGLTTEQERSERMRADDVHCETLVKQGIGAFVDSWQSLAMFETQRELSEQKRAFQRMVRLSHDAHALSRSVQTLGLAQMPNYWPSLSSIQIPTTLIAGKHDTKFSEIAVQMSKEIPRARVVVDPDAGHNVLLENPELVTQQIVRMYSELQTQ